MKCNKKNIKYVLLCMSMLVLCVVIIHTTIFTYSATMYDNDIRDNTKDKNIGNRAEDSIDWSKIGPIVDEKKIKPTAESTIDPNILYTTKKTWEKEKKDTIGIIIQKENVTPSEATYEYISTQKYTYIRHRSGIATISGEYLWEDYVDDNKEQQTRLLIYHSDDEQGLPHYAYSGFYQIGEDIYCFDKKGNLIKGMAMDEYDIIYEFDNETGKFIKQYKK